MKRFELSLLMGLCLCLALTLAAGEFHLAAGEVREQTLRLHIRANSDSQRDQSLKLLVRDAVAGRVEQLLQGCGSRESAGEILRGALPELAELASSTLAGAGCTEGVQLTLGDSWFPTRQYESGAALPAGEYRSLIIEIGSGQGRNWWCVLYPGVCIGASSGEPLDEYSDSAKTVVTGFGEYRVGFLLEEFCRWIAEAYRSSAS